MSNNEPPPSTPNNGKMMASATAATPSATASATTSVGMTPDSLLKEILLSLVSSAEKEDSDAMSCDSDCDSEEEEEEAEAHAGPLLPPLPLPPPPSPPTIYKRVIFSTVEGEEKVIENALEDTLFHKNEMPTYEDLMQQAAMDPLHSYIANMTEMNCVTNMEHIKHFQKSMEDEMKKNVNFIKRTTTHANECAAELGMYRQQAQQAQASLDNANNSATRMQERLDDFSSALGKHHSENVALAQDHRVAAVCLDTLKHIVSLHQTEKGRELLPYAKIKTSEQLKALASAFGVSDYDSTDLTVRRHISIARALKIFGFEYCDANSVGCLIASNTYKKHELRDQTCKCFGIIQPTTKDEEAMSSKKRKLINDKKKKAKKKAKKRRKSQQILSLASSPTLQAAVAAAVAAAAAQPPTEDSPNQDKKPAASASAPK